LLARAQQCPTQAKLSSRNIFVNANAEVHRAETPADQNRELPYRLYKLFYTLVIQFNSVNSFNFSIKELFELY
jgi:hypothetical protein